MGLATGGRLGPYEILSALGAGGMGEVYRARDTLLNREVAIKILPEVFAADADRLSRFQREAQVLASLNHPNIGGIYGLEDAEGIRALVLELVDGPTLADRIAHGPIPLDEALPIVRQISEALEAAHEHGIVHRDLKPANIKLRADGVVKVLDFGLAKALASDSASATAGDLSQSPTITSLAMTRMGIIMGTAAYMSPEQAKGKPLDKRTDIWAFGCVLYEMLTGKRAFAGEDVSDTLAAVLRGEPDWNALPSGTSSPIRKLLRRTIEKDRKRRLADIADARLDIDEAIAAPLDIASMAVSSPRARRQRLAWALVALAVLAATAALAVPYLRVPAAAEMRVDIATPETSDPISFAISPDGRRLVFVASGGVSSRLWLRSLDATTAQPLAGTEGARYPFWSPDSRSIGFFAETKLKRIDVSGGLPRTLANAVAPRGGTWSPDGVILFASGSTLSRIPASDGQAADVTTLTELRVRRSPFFLPGGRQFLFYVVGTPDTAGIYLGALDTREAKRLTASDTGGVYAPPGWLLFVRQGTLVAQRFDLERAALTGDPIMLADPVGADAAGNIGALSVSAAGLVAYRSGGSSQRALTWFGRSGQPLGIMGAEDDTGLSAPQLSPDGRRVAVFRTVEGNTDIWLMDTARTTRLTFDASFDRYPLWSPDGTKIVFDSNRRGHRDLYQKLSSGAGSEELLVESTQDKAALDWSSDGRFILFQSADPQTGQDLWILPMEGDHKPFVFLKTNFSEGRGQFSPDGRWVAYTSDESGRYEIYVRSFLGPRGTPVGVPKAEVAPDPPGGQWQISAVGGIWPRWSADGKELYYIAPDTRLMAVPIMVSGATLEPGTPVGLFQTRIQGGGSDPSVGLQYQVARDGRFLVNTDTSDVTSPITLILNWAGLTR